MSSLPWPSLTVSVYKLTHTSSCDDARFALRAASAASRLFYRTSTIDACTLEASLTSLPTLTRDTLLAIGAASSTA